MKLCKETTVPPAAKPKGFVVGQVYKPILGRGAAALCVATDHYCLWPSCFTGDEVLLVDLIKGHLLTSNHRYCEDKYYHLPNACIKLGESE